MTELAVSPWLLAAAFFLVALLYSSVGLGGGSSYAAILLLVGASQVAIPTVSLSLNIVVTSVGSLNFIRHRHMRWGLMLPFLVGSIPGSYAGGLLTLPTTVFQVLLLAVFIVIALRIYVYTDTSLRLDLGAKQQLTMAVLLGVILGFVSGTLGIGGGIFLIPAIIILGLGTPKQAAACGAFFIWINSIVGIAARLQVHPTDWEVLIPSAAAVLVGGMLGSQLGAARFSGKTIERILGLVVVVAAVFLVRTMVR